MIVTQHVAIHTCSLCGYRMQHPIGLNAPDKCPSCNDGHTSTWSAGDFAKPEIKILPSGERSYGVRY